MAYENKGKGLMRPCHHHPLRSNKGSFCCGLCGRYEADEDQSYCTTCNEGFHISCQYSSPKIIHPYHPTHPLTYHKNWGSYQYPADEKCPLCFQVIEPFDQFYRCSICGFSIHYNCMDYVRPLINHPECHKHDLAFEPEQRNMSFTCNVCGLTHSDMRHYKCVQMFCSFKVHEDCIYLPRAVKITSHQHRLSRIRHLPKSGEWSCEICHGGFDPNYGAYFCNIEGCSSAIHLRCATTADIWDEENPKKPAMDPMLPPVHSHVLRLESGRITSCEVCHQANETNVSYFYRCWSCKLEFHRGCAESSPKIKHPLHPHPLRLGSGPPFHCQGCSHSNIADGQNSNYYYYCDFCCVQFHAECAEIFPEIKHPLHPGHPLTLITSSGSPVGYFDTKCQVCGKDLKEIFYLCSTCDYFIVDTLCARKPPPLDIDHSKRHEHVLTLLPRRITFTCNACGMTNGDKYPYVCYHCNFMVHKDCADLPHLIKITRHEHRLFHTSFLPRGKWFCRICHQDIDGKYGEYSCIYKGCTYVAHSKCATRNDVWDGKDLEGESEEFDEYGSDRSFKVRDGGIISHCSHEEHDLRLNKDNGVCGEDKRCEACTLHVISGSFYSCVRKDCQFILHEICANRPRKIQHILHRHSLYLSTDHMRSQDIYEYCFACTACQNVCSGFKYRCLKMECNFQIDARCASVSEPFIHMGHEHRLFFPLYENKEKRCCSCGKKSDYMLNCVECGFVLDFECATLPSMVRYKYDEHLLSVCSGGEANGQHWCEICEERIDLNKWFYTCDQCGVNSHFSCMLGEFPFVFHKPGQSFINRDSGRKFKVVANNHIPRLLCQVCHCRCLDIIAFKVGNKYICFKCLVRY